MLSMAEAAPTAHQLLMAQVRLGEDTHREELVEQSLYRLELVEPNNPDVVAARFRYLLRRGNIDGAQKQLTRLFLLAPDSKIYQASHTAMRLSSPDGRQALQMARLQAISGRHKEAIANYDRLFNGAPPDVEMAMEYWSTVAQIASRRNEAISQLRILNNDNPDTGAILGALGLAVDLQHDAHLMQQDLLSFNVSTENDDTEDALPWHARLKERLSSFTARRAVTAPTATEIMTTSIQVLENRLKRNRMAGDPPDILIQPLCPQISTLDFHRANAAIAAGQLAVEKKMDELLPLVRTNVLI